MMMTLGFFTLTQEVQAEEAAVPYSVTPILPDNQADKGVSYFDLKVKAGSVQELVLQFSNSSNKEIKIQVDANTAVTNINGVIDYAQVTPELDKSMKYPFSELVTGPKEVTLKANETKKVYYQATIPKDGFDGVILGGFHVKELKATEDKKESTSKIGNEYAFVYGVKLTEKDKVIAPALELLKVTPGLVNYRTVLNVKLQNSQPVIMKDIDLSYKIYKGDKTDVVKEMKSQSIDMAPNSFIDLPIRWEKELKAGTYHLSMRADWEGKSWEWEKTFTITSAEAKEIKAEDVTIKEKHNPLIYVLIVIIILLLLALLFILFKRKKEKEQETEVKK